MIDLKNTYIENDKGELRDLYVNAVSDSGVTRDVIEKLDYNKKYIAAIDGINILQSCNNDNSIYGCTQITLADLKPRTKVEYVKCNESNTCVWDLKEMLSNGELFSESSAGEYAMYSNSAPSFMLEQFIKRGVFRKVETKIEWFDDIPVGGVLCANPNGGVSVVVKYDKSSMSPFESDDGDTWSSVTPLDKSEIEVLMNNAPE